MTVAPKARALDPTSPRRVLDPTPEVRVLDAAPAARARDHTSAARVADAAPAARLFATRPAGLVLRIRAGAGPARDRFTEPMLALLDDSPVIRCPGRPSIEALEGGVDLAATLAAGRTVRSDGLIARASGGVLLVLSAERVGASEAASLARAVDAGRLGLVLLDEGEGDEAPPPSLLDRVTLAVAPEAAPPEIACIALAETPRSRGPRNPTVPPAIRRALCEAALSIGIASLRPVLGAERIATHAATLAGRDEVADEDAALAAALVLAPRARRRPDAAGAPSPPSEPPSEPSPNDPSRSESPQDESSGETGEDRPTPETPPDHGAEHEGGGRTTAERVLAAVVAVLPPGLLDALPPTPPRRDAEARTGRPLPPRRGRLRAGARIAILPTIRAAAPLQLSRRQQAAAEGEGGTRRLVLLPSDVHLARARRVRRRNAIFVVDASGSAASARLAEAKGAIENLLAECYVRRDRVALLSVRGDGADLVLPPTAALTRARRLLAGLPAGGGTPLAAGLDAALALALALRRAGEDATVVLMTDGHANVARDGTPDRRRAQAEADASGARFRESGIPSLLVDIARRSGPEAERLAAAMNARYLKLPGGDTTRVGGAVRALSA